MNADVATVDWSRAERFLRRDPVLKPLLKRIGPCGLQPAQREPYEALVRAIAHQQVHGRAAEAMLGRLLLLNDGPAPFPSPRQVLELPAEALRGCGFSGAKVAAIRDIAVKAVGGLVPSLEEAARLSDAALIERLVAIRGVGRWTVEMLLMFTLGRADVLPVDDFGVREGWRVLTRATPQPRPKELAAIGAAWAPWRSVAAWYLWRAADEAKLAGKAKLPAAL